MIDYLENEAVFQPIFALGILISEQLHCSVTLMLMLNIQNAKRMKTDPGTDTQSWHPMFEHFWTIVIFVHNSIF